eukprot:gene9801-18362_t
MSDKKNYLENQLRRSNLKIVGLPEDEKEISWENTENVVKATVKRHLGLQEDLQTEREHPVGTPRLPTAKRHDGPDYVGPHGIIAKMSSWKQRERILQAALDKKATKVWFLYQIINKEP